NRCERTSRHMQQTAFLVLSAWSLATGASADDFQKARLHNWHHWRGPDANGTAPKADPPISWDKQKSIKWKAPLPGRGSATPIVWGDQVFILTAIPTGRAPKAGDLPRNDPGL